MPTEEEAKIFTFQTKRKTKFPQAYAAINGCHIAVSPPTSGSADYIIRKMFQSIVLQAVVDNQKRFRNIYVNMPGSAHDAAVLRLSGLYTIANGLPKATVTIQNVEVPLQILGDAAYPQSTWLVKPYIGRNLTKKEISFNCYHSSARIFVENAFGRLKSRWRILQKKLNIDIKSAPLIIASCCILHNICEEQCIDVEIDVNKDITPDDSYNDNHSQNDEIEGSVFRNAIKEYLAKNFVLRESSRF